MRILALALTAAATLSFAATPALAAPCKDAKGRFTKCTKTTVVTKSSVVRGKDGRCRVAAGPKKGQFTKC